MNTSPRRCYSGPRHPPWTDAEDLIADHLHVSFAISTCKRFQVSSQPEVSSNGTSAVPCALRLGFLYQAPNLLELLLAQLDIG